MKHLIGECNREFTFKRGGLLKVMYHQMDIGLQLESGFCYTNPMPFGKRKILAAFLENDNLKLLVFETGLGGRPVRIFAGQITFAPEIVRDGFIADPAKFASQIKIAFAQKEILRQTPEAVLFLPADKTFTKAIPAADSVDSFIQGLPYFKEELLIHEEGKVKSPEAGFLVSFVAFEKKLVEDYQRPFLEGGKKVLAVKSGTNALALKFAREGRYLLLAPLEKEVVTAVVDSGAVESLAAFKSEVAPVRIGEFVGGHNLKEMKRVFTIGRFDQGLLAKIGEGRGWEVTALAEGDIYDLTLAAALQRSGGPKINRRYLFLGGAILAGIVLVALVVSKVNLSGKQAEPVASPVVPEPAPEPKPEPKAADYPVRVLNGTLVTGEAGRLAEILEGKDFPILETKNATIAGFVATRLRAAEGVPEKIIAELKTLLLETYESVTIESLAEASEAKIEIIIGQKKKV